jgi:hypothetical protein
MGYDLPVSIHIFPDLTTTPILQTPILLHHDVASHKLPVASKVGTQRRIRHQKGRATSPETNSIYGEKYKKKFIDPSDSFKAACFG